MSELIVPEIDPYAYLDRSDFSSEKFKIEVKNLPKIYGISEFRKLLNNKLKLESIKIKTPKPNSCYAFICFRTEENRDKAIEILDGYQWKNKQLHALKAKPSPDPLVKKRKEQNDQNNSLKKQKIDNRTQEERLKSSTIPLWNVPYEEQIESKRKDTETLLQKLANQIHQNNPKLRDWLNKQKQQHHGLPCEYLGVRSNPITIDGYRNKCVFTVGIDEETNQKTVGFRIGSYVNGATGVGRVNALRHISEPMKLCVEKFEQFVRQSDLDAYNFELHHGNFRQLTVRIANNQIMAIVGLHPQNLDTNQLNAFKRDLIEFFVNGDGKTAKITSLYFQKIEKRAAGDDPNNEYELLHGDKYIYEELLGLKFRISPSAFFQINSNGAEILYKTIIELSDVQEHSNILDVCCGTGTIALCFAKHCKKVTGLEIVPEAIVDAKENAKTNNIKNSEFFVGKAEEILGNICHNMDGNVIAIVDPPRAGLHQKAIQQLRRMEKIDKLLYVACNPNGVLKNFLDLTRPESKTLTNEPFIPIRAVSIDMFPHTKHSELIIEFKRFNKNF